ncbi:hypothetical protein [Pseudoflavonifractor sp. An85]|uniref:hypothetical protein n=1 Tax=Pseudoflavonifractor sp. An85 TaxID=1965661 RepID=UPI000B3AB54C|nr:hypothetical protein [Pseudoflavonifractor sp. An85]OUN20951.1 hypothetical protein B5G37_11720 [Pseudoflavonifractor sp. An85]
MSERYDPQQPNYSLDDILAEFGSGSAGSYSTPVEEPVEESPQEPAPNPNSLQDPKNLEAIQELKKRLEVRPHPQEEEAEQVEEDHTVPEQAPQEQEPQAEEEEPSKAKVVPFPDQQPQPKVPDQPPTPGPEPVQFAKKEPQPQQNQANEEDGDEAPMPVIEPATLLRHLGARLSTLQRRADHYADHMYDQAEPDSETVKVETYLPGVDQETPPKAPKKKKVAKPPKPARVKPVKPPPPDTPPAELAARYQKGLKARRHRVTAGWLLSLLAIIVSVPLPISIPFSLPGMSIPQLKAWILAALLAMVGILCMEILVVGFTRLFQLHPRAETLAALAWLFSLLDALTFGVWPQRGDAIPCCAVTALGLSMAMWGRCLRQQGDRLSAKAASQVSAPYVVSLDEDKWNHRPAYCKWAGIARGFGSQLQMEDGAQKAWSIATPVLLVVCLAFALLSSVAQQAPERFLWAASASFTAAASYSALLCYALPYQKLAARLYKVGAAMAGWAGVSRCRHAGIVLTDGDLFPPGTVQVSHFELYGNVPKEKVVSYAATLLKVADCDLTQPFYKLLQSTGALYREASGVRFHEGGITGIIHNHDIIVGTSDFMHLVDIPLPRSLKVKHAIFCAIDGQLAAMFPVSYSLPSAVRPSLSTLIGLKVTPILATRDPNLIPALLDQKFKLPVDKMEFPSTDRRRELSDTMQEHSTQPVAVLSREGVGVFCDTVLGCRRLRWATRLSLGFSLAGAALGVCLTFFLTYSGSYEALSPVNFLVFMLAWLVPELLIAGWVNQY